ncbi:MAG: alpha/beta hydrolase [Pseudomonadota bacterium]
MLIEPITASTADRQPICHTLSLRLKNRALAATIHVPANIDPSCPPLLALHGISRNAAAISASFAPTCLARGQVLIVPRFSRKHWPHFQQIGRMRADRALLELLATVQSLGFGQTGKIDLFGYSGGAQLAHRFAMLYPNRIDTLHLAAAGWYCLPNTSLAFPMGLGLGRGLGSNLTLPNGTPDRKMIRNQQIASLARVQLDTFLKLRFRIYVGDQDDARDPALRKSTVLDLAQGKSRRARARTYARCVSVEAQKVGIPPDVALSEIPGCAHSFRDCAAAGMTSLVCR